MQHTFSIIIVTWNGIDLLKKFLPTVMESTYPNVEIVIADNASTDSTADWVNQNYPNCKVVTFDDNYGYCGGNNRAVEHCNGDILLFLNNDVRVEPEWLSPINSLFQDSNVTIAQPKIRSLKNPDYFEYAGAAGGMIDYMGYPFCRGRLFDHVEKDEGQYDTSEKIFWASGASLAIRKEAFEKLGGFDESFEFHMEEIDLCWRAWKMGYTVKSCPESVVYHLGGGSLPMGSSRKVYYNFRNSLLMITKNDSGNGLFFKIFFRLLLDGLAGIRMLLQLKPGATWAIIKAHFGFYRHLPSVLKKRKTIQRSSNSNVPDSLIYPRLIIIEAFVKGAKKQSDLS